MPTRGLVRAGCVVTLHDRCSRAKCGDVAKRATCASYNARQTGATMTQFRGARILWVLGACMMLVEASAQSFPNRPLRIINPFPPGGGVDITNRIVATKLTEVLGQQVVVENRAGAAGNVGAAIAAKATPDGYTMFACGVASHGVSPAIY